MNGSTSVDVAVIGAGPYGLAVATHLRARGVGAQVIGRPMSSWRERMPRGMYLKSEGFASSIAAPLPGYALRQYCAELGTPYADIGAPVALDTFSEYGLWFARALVPNLIDAEVDHVRPLRERFEVTIEGGTTLVARSVVVACGFPRFRHTPPELEHLSPDRVSHSSDHADVSRFEGKDVVVVGAGQSALETAALLREHGANPTVVARRHAVSWNDPPETLPRSLRRRVRAPLTGLGTGWSSWVYCDLPFTVARLPAARRVRLASEVLGPAGAWWLRDRVVPRLPVLPGRTLIGAAADNGMVRLRFVADGEAHELEADHVIAATGYRVRLDRLRFLDEDLVARLQTVAGAPALTSSFESSVPGLYFVGMAAAHTFGPVMRFVCGTGFAARRVSRRLSAATRRRRRLAAT